ncbi:MAG: threonine synthase [Bacteroidetes bacterium]|nr:threonine synthase [Bacteroidota bacterium]
MKFYSLNKQSPAVDFKEATIRGLAPDKGLYFPEYIPLFTKELLESIDRVDNATIAYEVIREYAADVIPPEDLGRIAKEAIDFEIPLVQVDDNISSLELFHGPTLAFKDVGARFMSRCLGYFAKERNQKVVVLVATSGDTGGAVANGFYNVDGVEVVILYPSGKVSSVQEKQLTTLGNNIHALEVKGNFDDCQPMVKEAFADKELNERLFLTSANSINIARWLPQQFYYLLAWKQWEDKSNPPVIAVPSGNFGNICAGIMAYKSGMPVKHFIAACNANDTVPEFFRTGKYEAKKAVPTISNAMDVGDPSNFIRIQKIFSDDITDMKKMISSCSISDEETRNILKKVFEEKRYLMDTHGAVAYLALQRYLENNPGSKGIFLETAHPVKFYDVVEPIIGQQVPIPELVQQQLKKEKSAVLMNAESNLLKEYLLHS